MQTYIRTVIKKVIQIVTNTYTYRHTDKLTSIPTTVWQTDIQTERKAASITFLKETTYSSGLVTSQEFPRLHHLYMPDTTVRRKNDRHEEQQTPTDEKNWTWFI